MYIAIHSRFLSERGAETSQIILRDTHISKMTELWDAVCSQSISGVSVDNPLTAVYDICEIKRKLLFYFTVPDTILMKCIDESLFKSLILE
jgi:hypothetical protein